MNRSNPLPMWRVPGMLALLLLAGACASTNPVMPQRPGVITAPVPGGGGAPSGTSPPPPGAPAAPGATPLAQEQRFLEGWFRGTPVVIAAQPPTTLQLDVPLSNSFDPGKSDVKPALNAVLDRVAQSLLRHASARLVVTVSADTDGGSPALAQARTQRVREALATKGVAATRVSLIESTRGGVAVQLRLLMPTLASQPIARGEGSRAGSGVQPVSTQRSNAPMWTEKK